MLEAGTLSGGGFPPTPVPLPVRVKGLLGSRKGSVGQGMCDNVACREDQQNQKLCWMLHRSED